MSKKDKMTLRYVYENEIHEEFLGYTYATSLDAEGLTGFILANLNKWGIAVEKLLFHNLISDEWGFEWSPSIYSRAF